MVDPGAARRIEAVEPETADSVTVVIQPGWVWPGHEPGQYLRVGVVVDGVHHWRAYSLTSDPGRPDGCISITPKLLRRERCRRIWCATRARA